MQVFVLDDAVQACENRLQQSSDEVALAWQIELAWHLRQRDCARAQSLAEAAQSTLHMLPQAQQAAAQARIMLILGEIAWLEGHSEQALQLAQNGLAQFSALQDGDGMSDAQVLMAWTYSDLGYTGVQGMTLAAAAQCTHDPLRQIIAQASLARWDIFTDARAARQKRASLMPHDIAKLDPIAQAAVADFWGMLADMEDQLAESITWLEIAFEQSLRSGQIRRALMAASNLANVYLQMHDPAQALRWSTRMLELARPLAWPELLGCALLRQAEVLAAMHRHAQARPLLAEALQTSGRMPASYNYANTLDSWADNCLALNKGAEALQAYTDLEARARALSSAELLHSALNGQAHSHALLGDLAYAHACVEIAAALPQGMLTDQIAVWRLLAHTRHLLQQDGPGALACLERALSLSQQGGQLHAPLELLEDLQNAYLESGQDARAWVISEMADAALAARYDLELQQRADAMQAAFAAEQRRSEAAHQRELEEVARRADVMRQTGEILEHLSKVGQEITSSLNLPTVFESIERHVQTLFAQDCLSIFLYEVAAGELQVAYHRECGQMAPPHSLRAVPVDVENAFAAQCWRSKQEILCQHEQGPHPWFQGTRKMRQALYLPLQVADEVIGVLSLQSLREHAWTLDRREQLILRTLCGYTAIAIANARTHAQLAHTHTQLESMRDQILQQEKMAGLGTLTAGVAHEINDPANLISVAAQSLRIDLEGFAGFVYSMLEADEAGEIVPQFDAHFMRLRRSMATIGNGAVRIGGIVRDLRQFSRPDESEALSMPLSEIMLSTMTLVKTGWQDKIKFTCEIWDDPPCPCRPAQLGQVFMNLIVNACHAIEQRLSQSGGAPGLLQLRLRQQGTELLAEVEDNGCGMDEAVRARILEPFFTTKQVGKGSGLGLSIAFGIIEKHGGRLQVRSNPGTGSCFQVYLPLPGDVAAQVQL